MKKKERVHLKEDPFQIFIENVLTVIKKYKSEIFIGVSAAAAIVIIILLVSFLRSGSISSENQRYAEALAIQNSDALTTDQKIEKLSQLDAGSGISSSIKLSLAALYFEKGEITKAGEVLAQFPNSKYKLINDKKKLLEAEVLKASGKEKEALDILYKLFSDPGAEIGKDFILFKMARIQVKAEQLETAAANLKKITEDYPQSLYSRDAQALLTEIENK
jgi:outer membrane protein assembly factor BamD (BamD/ComL family)